MISSVMHRYGRKACPLFAITFELSICLSFLSPALAESKTVPSSKKSTGNSAAPTAKQDPAEPAPGVKRPRGPARVLTAEEQKILQALSVPTTVGFVDTQLTDALNFLKDQHGIKIQLDEAALAEESIGTDTPITLNLSDITLHSVLNLMLKGNKLGFTIENNALQITTRTKLSKRELPAELVDFATRDRKIKQSHANLQMALRTKISVNFIDTQIADALLYLHQEHKIPIFAIQDQIAEANIALDQAITLKVENAPISDILNRLLEPSKLKFWIEDEVIKIGVQDPDDERLHRIKARKQNADAAGKTPRPAGKSPQPKP